MRIMFNFIVTIAMLLPNASDAFSGLRTLKNGRITGTISINELKPNDPFTICKMGIDSNEIRPLKNFNVNVGKKIMAHLVNFKKERRLKDFALFRWLKKRMARKFLTIAAGLCILMPGIIESTKLSVQIDGHSNENSQTLSVQKKIPNEKRGKFSLKGQSERKFKSRLAFAENAPNENEGVSNIANVVVKNAKEIGSDFENHLTGGKRDVLLLLMAVTLVIPLCKRAGFSPILGFLATGTAIGPNGFRLIADVKATEVLGELGIVFFLFEMGLELSVERLKAMKKDVFGLGLAQFFITAVGIGLVANYAGINPAALLVIGGGMALSSSAFVLQLLKDRDDMGTRYGRASFGILLLQDLAVVPLLVAIPLLAGTGGSVAKALGSAATKACIALGTIAFLGQNVLDRLFFLVARSRNQEAFLAVILLTVLSMSGLTEGLGLSNTLGAFLAGVLLSETKYRYQVEADIAPFRGMLLGLFFMTVGFEIDIGLVISNLPMVGSLVLGLLALKASITTLICLTMGLSLANAQQTGLLLSQGGEFAFVAFGMAERLGILGPNLTRLLLTTVAISMAATPFLSSASAKLASRIEGKLGFSHFIGNDKESDEIKEREDFVVVVGYGRIGRLVCDLLDKKFIPYVAFEVDPKRAVEARQRGFPVFYGDATRPEVLRSFNVGKAKSLISTISDIRTANKAVITIRREFPNLPVFARAVNAQHQKRLQGTLNVTAMVPVLPEDSIMVSLPFGGAFLRSLGLNKEEVNILLEDTRKKYLDSRGLEVEETENILEQLSLNTGKKSGEADGEKTGEKEGRSDGLSVSSAT